MNSQYRQVHFLTSAARPDQGPLDQGYEVAFAGRSNAGKSTAINALCDQKALARTSKTPGRTQLLNFFAVDEERRLVDLPGYGYAKVAEGVKRDWQQAMSTYLGSRECLRGIILVMDIRNPLKPYDRQMLDWASHFDIPCHILLSKADKLKGKGAEHALAAVAKELDDASVSLQTFSGQRKWGIDEAHQVLDVWFEFS